jgi:hypothetical protein
LSFAVAEIFRDRQRRQSDPPARAGRLIHLAVDQHATIEHAGPPHFGEELVAFAGALADAGEDGNALVAFDHRMDELHDDDGLADTGAAEHGGLASLRQRRQKVDDLDTGFEYRGGRTAVAKRRGLSVDGRPQHVVGQWRSVVADVADDIEETTENRIADRHGDRTSGRAHRHSALQSRGRLQRNAAHGARVEMRLNLDDEGCGPIPFDDESLLKPRKLGAIEGDINHRAAYGEDLSCQRR